MTQHQHTAPSWTRGDEPVYWRARVATFDGNSVEHVTFFPAGDEVWFTFTETGKVTVTWDGVTYTGHVTAWGNFNMNERNSNRPSRSPFAFLPADGSERRRCMKGDTHGPSTQRRHPPSTSTQLKFSAVP